MNYTPYEELDQTYYMPVYGKRLPVCFVKGKNNALIDSDGKSYTDFFSGIAVNCLGYSDKGLKKTIKAQADALLTASNYFYTDKQTEAAKVLAEATGYDRVFFANSGTEAIEGALKLARKYFFEQGKNQYEVITMKGSFHGRTMAALAATGQPHFHTPFEPLPTGFVSVEQNNIEAVKNAITPKTCAVLLEPIMGEGGVIPVEKEFYQELSALTKEKGILLIADEIQTGMGRTGAFLASTLYGVKPDIITLAKALGGGVPVGAFLTTDAIAKSFSAGDHGSTFGGNCLASAAVSYMVKTVSSPSMLEQICSLGAYLKQGLCALQQKYSSLLLAVRGEGLMLGVPPNSPLPVKEVLRKMLECGFVVGSAGNNTLRLLPPYTITTKEIDALLSALDNLFSTISL